MKVFATYMIFIVGGGLMIVPHLLLSLFSLTAGDDIWVRMVGLLAFILGINYFLMVKTNALELIRGSIWLRYFAALFMCALVLLNYAGLPLVLFAAIDFAAATWTLLAMKKQN